MSKQVNEPATKPGKYGTLYLYQIAYCDASDSTIAFSTRVWAYDSEHALDKFYAGEEGWKATSWKRVPASGLVHRAQEHAL